MQRLEPPSLRWVGIMTPAGFSLKGKQQIMNMIKQSDQAAGKEGLMTYTNIQSTQFDFYMNWNSYCIGHVWTQVEYKPFCLFLCLLFLYCDVNLCVRSSCTSFYAVSWIPQGPQLNNFFRDTVRLMLNSDILICVKIDSKFWTLFIISIGWNTVDWTVEWNTLRAHSSTFTKGKLTAMHL